MNIEHILGFIAGIIAGLGLVYFLSWIIKKMGGKIEFGGGLSRRCNADNYDERQQLARGVAYKRAFFVLMLYISVVSMLSEVADIIIFMSFGGMWLGVCIALIVFAVSCIFQDAYMSLYENAKGVSMMFSIVGVLNLVIASPYLTGEKPVLEDGVISASCVNLMVGVAFIVILFAFIGRVLYNNKRMEEDEE